MNRMFGRRSTSPALAFSDAMGSPASLLDPSIQRYALSLYCAASKAAPRQGVKRAQNHTLRNPTTRRRRPEKALRAPSRAALVQQPAGQLHRCRSGQPGEEVVQDVLPHILEQVPQPVEPTTRLIAVITTAVIGRYIHRHARAGAVGIADLQVHGAGQALGDLD